ncbi:prolyl aminopeptidase [Methyloprofundus sp.]|uniref:prolyl aminopeptidase n=1 Tax=Methyloprofundus sp. TaxID=2020875 RepID=UPI003D1313D4
MNKFQLTKNQVFQKIKNSYFQIKAMSQLKYLYPHIQPYKTGRLKVDDRHELYYEEVGNPDGQPVVFLHGGPGGGIESDNRKFFDPNFYRVILFDQRGAGKSTPKADIVNNSTWDLVSDIEKLRTHVGIDQWIVFGGSWGSTLALAYAETHPKKVKALALRGIFLSRPKEIEWFYQKGAGKIYPEDWEKFIEIIPEQEQQNIAAAYYKRLTSEDPLIRQQAAESWSTWEASCSFVQKRRSSLNEFSDADLSLARIECHYFINNSFFQTDNWLIENIDCIRNIPCQIVHGRHDMICPIENCWDLQKAWPEAKLHIIEDAGHSAKEPGTVDRLIRIMDDYKNL